MPDLAEFVNDYFQMLKEGSVQIPPVFKLRDEIAEAYLDQYDPEETFTAEQIKSLKEQILYYLS